MRRFGCGGRKPALFATCHLSSTKAVIRSNFDQTGCSRQAAAIAAWSYVCSYVSGGVSCACHLRHLGLPGAARGGADRHALVGQASACRRVWRLRVHRILWLSQLGRPARYSRWDGGIGHRSRDCSVIWACSVFSMGRHRRRCHWCIGWHRPWVLYNMATVAASRRSRGHRAAREISFAIVENGR